ncbi:HNH endonuclease [Aggregatibacter segnis]|uniref:HNH endonuclease n=1 Tax=Aggregatibacter segnis TaxID=739 RepID=UPI000D69B18E|nr:HNH endonuclease [Aggregatibacter segnis]
MNNCIICRQKFTEKNPATQEHVIPYSIGGNYVIHTICKNCNSSMGTKIDAPFARTIVSRLHIEENQIIGRNGKIDFPLKGDYQDDSGNKYRVESPNSAPILLDDRPKIEIKNLNSDQVQVSVSFEKYGYFSNDERIKLLNKHKKYLDKEYKKLGLEFNLESLLSAEFTKEVKEPKPLHKRELFDFNPFFLESLKIAYEFFVTNYPHYLDHQDIKDIAKILKNAESEKAKKYVSLQTIGSETEYARLAKCLKDRFGTIFMVVPLTTPTEGTGYFISLYEKFISLVTLSNENLIGSRQVGVYIYCLNQKKELQYLYPYSSEWIKFQGCLNLCKL